MILKVRVTPKANRVYVRAGPGYLKVYLTKPAENGLANNQLIEALAKHLSVRKYQIKIRKGHSSRDKLIEISG